MSDFTPQKVPLRRRKYAEYIQDFTALGNPFVLLLITTAVLQNVHFADGRVWLWLLGAFIAGEALCSGIKYLWHKPRPDGQLFKGALEKIDAGSFPSIHAFRIAYTYSSLAYLQYVQSGGGLLFPLVALVVVAVVGYSRVFLRKHFATDVAAGYAIGLSVSAALWLGVQPV